ncbi:citrate lyase [Sphingomonas sp. Leaf357]|uniref:HpcH/HpaI aldolase/citrate lyase family protein n=1 Tax=Sphingomonas sp. Leaf357 TaxID=1736350 RepID=UPI0006F47066|nr:CoA ester lyase [Sphingomonas sp. Leaf357]KQS03672.1 citrate lyase [Sphingomonas sp. Leaf357]
MRSWLFVPGDSARKLTRARNAGSDVLILDLEDAVAPDRKTAARAMVAEAIDDGPSHAAALFVRVNALDTGLTLDDLVATVRPGLDGIMLPKANGVADALRVSHYLDALEWAAGIPTGRIKLIVVATETPAAMFALGGYGDPPARLVSLTWGAEDLSAAIGASANQEAGGAWTAPYRQARTSCLFAAAAAGVAPIDTLFGDYRDTAGLDRSCAESRRDGFVGRIAIHPDQVSTINRCFSPSDEELDVARRIVAAFAARPEAGALGIDGRMYDLPHLKAARRMLATQGA